MKELIVPFFDQNKILNLRAGDRVLLTGKILTMRDAAHELLVKEYNDNKSLPINLENQVVFYAGPTPAKPTNPIGSIGPTTSIRMDEYTPTLLSLGLKGMIGKGYRSIEVKEAIKKYKGVYFVAYGGIAALLAKKITSQKVLAYEHLGTEAIRQLTVEKFPCLVINDSVGNDFYNK